MDIKLVNSISVEDYNNIRESVGWLTLEVNQAKRGIDNTFYLVCAMDGEKPIGLARLISDGGYVAYISDVIVSPKYQGNGIGQMMLENLMDFIRNELSGGEPVMVNLMSAFDKELFYEKFGFIKRPNDSVGAGMFQWINLDDWN
jgi:ribosomal protein S18 acetylase RimI-like enzyme